MVVSRLQETGVLYSFDYYLVVFRKWFRQLALHGFFHLCHARKSCIFLPFLFLRNALFVCDRVCVCVFMLFVVFSVLFLCVCMSVFFLAFLLCLV